MSYQEQRSVLTMLSGVATLVFIGALIAVRLGVGPVGMLLVMAISGVISEVVGETTRIVMYRRGM